MMELIAVFILQVVVGGAVSGLFAAVLLRRAAMIVIKRDLGFGAAFLTAYIAILVSAPIGFLLGLMVAAVSQGAIDERFLNLPFAAVGLFVQAGVLSVRQDIGLGLALRVTLLALGFAVVIVLLGMATILGFLYFSGSL